MFAFFSCTSPFLAGRPDEETVWAQLRLMKNKYGAKLRHVASMSHCIVSAQVAEYQEQICRHLKDDWRSLNSKGMQARFLS